MLGDRLEESADSDQRRIGRAMASVAFGAKLQAAISNRAEGVSHCGEFLTYTLVYRSIDVSDTRQPLDEP